MTTTTYNITDATTGLPWSGGGSVTITDPSLAVAQAMVQAAANIGRRALTLSCPTLGLYPSGQPQTFTYQPGPAPVGYWQATYAAIFAAIGSSTTLSQQESVVGQTIAASLKLAGNAYDLGSTAGVKNASLYALQRNAWAQVVASPAWLELDRVCRYAYGSIASQAAIVQAAFAGTGPVWQPSTLFGSATGLLFHPTITPGYCIPNPTNGFVYSGYGTTGSTQPTFPTVIGQTSTGDGYVTGWTCVAATGQAGAVLPFDQTLNSVITLNLRYSAAQQLASGNSALLSLLTTAQAGWATALAAQPAQNGSQDYTSFVVTQVLQNFIGQAQTWLAAESFQ